METTDSIYTEALRLQRVGRLNDARQRYAQVLQRNPNHADALHFLGVLLHQLDLHRDAIQSISSALALKPNNATYHGNLGLALRAVGKSEEAAACFEESLRIRPDNPIALNNLGVVRLEQLRFTEAKQCFDNARRFRQDDPEIHNNLGKTLLAQRRYDLAAHSFREAIRLKADYAEALNNLAAVLRETQQHDEAIERLEQALRLRPDYRDALNNLGGAYIQRGDPQQAESHLRRVVEIDPAFAAGHCNLGVALMDQGLFAEAEQCFVEARRLRPDFAGAVTNLGAAYLFQGRVEPALECLNDALRIEPDHVDAHWNRALAWLSIGRYQEGWLEYQWRWLKPGKSRRIPRPLWNGSDLDGKTIMLHSEQGLGDTIQFFRYASLVKQRGGRLLVVCQAPLVPLLSRQDAVEQVVAQTPELPPFDLHAPLMSLPGILGTTLESVPASVPYLAVEAERTARWRQHSLFREDDSFRIGIAWQGNPGYRGDQHRSIPLAHFRALAELPGVRLVSLQKGHGIEQIAQADFPITTVADLDDTEPFMDSAALMQHLDLVISSDSAIAHLAGALGAPIWLPLPYAPDWRWMQSGDHSPWYPSMRLFRQPTPGDWPAVFNQLAATLRALMRGDRKS